MPMLTHCHAPWHIPLPNTHVIRLWFAYPKELQRCHDDLKRARADLNKQKAELDEKREALQALKKANEEKEAELLSEISRLKEQSQKDKAELERELEKAKEVNLYERRDCMKCRKQTGDYSFHIDQWL